VAASANAAESVFVTQWGNRSHTLAPPFATLAPRRVASALHKHPDKMWERMFILKFVIPILVFLFASSSGWALKITNATKQSIWCSVYCMKDQLPVESMTWGWWEIADGGSATIGGEGGFVCNAYFCKSATKQWTEKKSGVQVNACVDEKSSPFKIRHADRPDECRRLGATTVTFGLMNPDANVRLVP
jgi:hypothetical protein